MPLFRRKLDQNHRALLTEFLKPNDLGTANRQKWWSRTLKRPYRAAINNLVKRGMLAEAPVEARLNLGLRVADLKPILKQRELKVSGKKADLIARLLENAPEDASRLAQQVIACACTPAGAELAHQYQHQVAGRQREAEEQVRSALRRGNVKKASRMVHSFAESLPMPMRWGLGGIETDPTEATALLAVAAVPGFSADEVERLRFQATEDALWGRTCDVPEEFEAVVYKTTFGARNEADLEQYQSWRVDKVDILATDDSCPSCKELEANGPYPADTVPALPNPDCAHHIGWCRCTYLPVIED